MTEQDEIIAIFSYTESEQETFEYLREYMTQIDAELFRIKSNEASLKRFALAGLFLTYRAYNHSGNSFTTEIASAADDSVHQRRLLSFKSFFGTEISGSSEYLEMIEFSLVDMFLVSLRIKQLSTKLCNFVVN